MGVSSFAALQSPIAFQKEGGAMNFDLLDSLTSSLSLRPPTAENRPSSCSSFEQEAQLNQRKTSGLLDNFKGRKTKSVINSSLKTSVSIKWQT